MAGIDDWTWPELLSIVEDAPGVLEQLLVHLERSGKIPKELTRDLAGDKEWSDAVDDSANELSREEARKDLTSRLLLLVSNLRDVRKQGGPKEGRPRRTPARDLPIGQKRADDDPHLWSWYKLKNFLDVDSSYVPYVPCRSSTSSLPVGYSLARSTGAYR